MYGYYQSMMTGWGGGISWFGMMVFWLVVIGIIVWVISISLKGLSGSGQRHSNTLEILKERYAKGEISKEEYDQKRKDLEG